MSKKNVEKLLPFNLQFFAEPEGEDTSENKDSNENEFEEEDVEEEEEQKKKPERKKEKTFTQRQVNAMMSKEKREGKKSILSSLGFENEEEAQKAVKLLRVLTDSQKSDEEKKNDGNKGLEKEKSDAEERAARAEAKLSCLTVGVDKDCIDDVLSIAYSKVDDENTLEDVLNEMKKNKKYSAFFENSSKGTGGNPGHTGKSNSSGKGEYGKKLAESGVVKTKKKSSYFQ